MFLFLFKRLEKRQQDHEDIWKKLESLTLKVHQDQLQINKRK
jgi:hypothetical protein